MANDTGNSADCCSMANVIIQLIDINDHIPEFPDPLYKLEVEEHCANGTILGIIQVNKMNFMIVIQDGQIPS